MKQANITVYGTPSCGDTQRAIAYLDSVKAPYEFKNLDEQPELNDYIAGLNDGKRVMPTIQIDNDILINPDDQKLAEALSVAEEAR
jgi:glutaredoxin